MTSFGTLHFTLDFQRAFIRGHGQQALVFPVLQCPCLLEDRQFAPTCPTCHGSGRFYPPDRAFATTLLLHLEDSHRTFPEAGTWIDGSIRATILPGVHLSDRDKVRLLDIRDTFNDEVLVQGLDDTLRFSAGVDLLLVADRSRVYRAGVDYVLTPPATITWLPTGQQPGVGQQYAVSYDAAPEFLVTPDSPRLRVEYHVPQAQEVVLLRLDHLSEEV
jgi:hypothetical protein